MPTAINISRKRGDTYDEVFTIKQNDVEVDITGYTFLLTVSTKKAPPDVAAQLFQVSGSIPTGTDGVVNFAISLANSDQIPKVYHYDVQMTDSGGKITTAAEGTWTVTQDITKT